MKNILFVLLLIIPCICWGATYSGITVYSITTSGDINPEISINAGCVFTGVSVDQAIKMGLVNIGLGTTANSQDTTYQDYDLVTQTAVIRISEQAFTYPAEGLTRAQFKTEVRRYVIRKYKGYAEEIVTRYFLDNNPSKGSFNLDNGSTSSPAMLVNKEENNIYSLKENTELFNEKFVSNK